MSQRNILGFLFMIFGISILFNSFNVFAMDKFKKPVNITEFNKVYGQKIKKNDYSVDDLIVLRRILFELVSIKQLEGEIKSGLVDSIDNLIANKVGFDQKDVRNELTILDKKIVSEQVLKERIEKKLGKLKKEAPKKVVAPKVEKLSPSKGQEQGAPSKGTGLPGGKIKPVLPKIGIGQAKLAIERVNKVSLWEILPQDWEKAQEALKLFPDLKIDDELKGFLKGSLSDALKEIYQATGKAIEWCDNKIKDLNKQKENNIKLNELAYKRFEFLNKK